MASKTQFCLRPNLTANIHDLLADSKKINLYGSDGQGLTRLVEDLAKIAPDNKHFIRLSMRSYADSYVGFMNALQKALGVQSSCTDFAAAILAYMDKSPKGLWLVIEHFDRLTEKPTQSQTVDVKGYDRSFLDQLNSFGNNSKISLLLTSVRKIDTQELYIGGKNIRGSKLELSKHLDLTPLTFDLLKAELTRQLNGNIDKKVFFDSPEWACLVGEISIHPKAYDFLTFIAPRIETSDVTNLVDFQKQVNFWKSDFNNANTPSVDLRLNRFEKFCRHLLHQTNRIVGLGIILKKLNTKWRIIIAGSSAFAFSLWKWGEQILIWLKDKL